MRMQTKVKDDILKDMKIISESERKKAQQLLKQLSLSEKCSLLTGKDYWHIQGIPRLHLPDMMVSDGPSGLRKQEGKVDYLGMLPSKPTICYPCPSACASTFDPNLLEQLGIALGEECVHEEIGILLTPGINHKRSSLGGRNFEYYSEDPYVTETMAEALINGLQSTGVGCSLKHFCCNNQETARMINNSIVDDRALAQIYLRPFEKLIQRTQPATIMLAYNQLNGIYCAENKDLMDLGRQWGFQGFYMSDWGGVNDRFLSIKNGLSLEMPGMNKELCHQVEKKIQEGEWEEDELDQRILPILEILVHHKNMQAKKEQPYTIEREALAKKIARESIVLLKNEDNLLPLSSHSSIALIGNMAKYPRYQGAGSSNVNTDTIESLCDFLPFAYYAKGYDENGHTNDVWLQEAEQLAKRAQVALVVVGLPLFYETEGYDKKDLSLPAGMRKLIERVLEANENTIVVVESGSPVLLPHLEKIKGLVFASLLGSYGGSAIAEILMGQISPSGKLNETFVRSLSQIPILEYPRSLRNTYYIESIYTGYRYYDAAKIDVAFPFGYGLSYTSFFYSNGAKNGNSITFDLTNTGKMDGKEVVQLYVSSSAPFSVPKLLRYKKISLKPQETKHIELFWEREDLEEYFDPWILREGDYTFYVGSSSRDRQLSFQEHIDGANIEVPNAYQNATYVKELDLHDFHFLIAYEEKENIRPKRYGMNTTIQDLIDTNWIYRLLIRGIMKKMLKDDQDTYKNLIEEMPLRILRMYGVSQTTMEGLFEMLNGKWIQGWKKINQNEIKKVIHDLEGLHESEIQK